MGFSYRRLVVSMGVDQGMEGEKAYQRRPPERGDVGRNAPNIV